MGAEADEESLDTLSPLITTTPGSKAPGLRVNEVSTNSPPSAQSTRRWFSSVFSTPPKDVSADASGATLKEVIEKLRGAGDLSVSDEVLATCGKRLLDLVPSLDKVAKATKVGAHEALLVALHERGVHSVTVAHALLPPLVNISAGDDEAGLKRASVLVQLGTLETLTAVLNAHGLTGDNSTDASDPVLDTVFRCIWVMQHLCRRTNAASSPWLAKLTSGGILDAVIKIAARFPSRRKLLTRVCFFLADICYALSNGSSGVSAGMASGVHLSPHDSRMTVLPTILQVLQMPLDVGENPRPAVGCEVHEAACLALGDVCVGPVLLKSALDAGAAFLIVNAMQRFPSAVELQAVGCRAFRVMWLAAGKNEELKTAIAEQDVTETMLRALDHPYVQERVGTGREAEYRQVVEQIVTFRSTNGL